MAPIIGISVCIDRGQKLRAGADYYYVRRDYAARLRAAGGLPLLLPLDAPPLELARLCAACVITGGDDLPCSFDADGSSSEWAEDAERIQWDRELLEQLRRFDKPVLGICYGMQLMNLHYGGSLYREIGVELPSVLDHGGLGRTTQHGLRIESESKLWGVNPPRIVNSSHRQAIDQVAPGFKVTARAEDGIVEAIERGREFGVEWHPETDALGVDLLTRFVAVANEP